MKRMSSFVLPSILSLALTVSPVLAQSPTVSRSDDTKADAEKTNAPMSSGQTLDQKNIGNGVPVLSELPPSDTSNPPGRTSRGMIIGLIVGGAAVVAALILAFHGGDKTTGTVLTPGTATVNPPGR
jgi:hypothetical protein